MDNKKREMAHLFVPVIHNIQYMEKENFTLEEAEKAIKFVTENGYCVKGFIKWLDDVYEQIAEAYIQLGHDAPTGTNDILNTLYTIRSIKKTLGGLLPTNE